VKLNNFPTAAVQILAAAFMAPVVLRWMW